MLLNCVVGEDSWKSLGLQGDPTSPSKGNQSWVFIVRIDADIETSILWPPDGKNWLLGKYPDAGKDWRWEEKGTMGEMVGWYHRLYGHEFEQAPGVGDGQGGLVCCSPWGCKESDTTEQLNWTELCRTGACPALACPWSTCIRQLGTLQILLRFNSLIEKIKFLLELFPHPLPFSSIGSPHALGSLFSILSSPFDSVLSCL